MKEVYSTKQIYERSNAVIIKMIAENVHMTTGECNEWVYLPLQVMHCCNVHHNKNMSGAEHDVDLKRLCPRYIAFKEDMISRPTAYQRSVRERRKWFEGLVSKLREAILQAYWMQQ